MALEPSDLALPSISPLPPIEMPDSEPTSGGSLERDRSSFLRRSSASLASHNSFTTAMSSTSAQKTPPGSPDRSLSPALHESLALTTQSLRKSISVDSFVKRDAPKIGSRPKRTNTDLTVQVPVVQPSGSRDYEHHPLQRNRGVSFSTRGDYNTSAGDDLDLEPWSSRRRASLKGKDSQLPSVPPGELKLPPRIPALSSTSSTSSISTTPSNSRDEYRRLHATTSMQSIPGRIANPVLASISGRARSGSLGVKVDSGGKPIFINTQIPSKSFNESVDPVTIAVVGAPGAGKSTVIRKGAKQFSLSDFTVLSAPPGMLGVQTPLRYVRRIGHVTDIEILGEMTPSCPLHLLEIDIGNLGWDQPTSHPSNDSSAGAPQVDGVLICYDATSQSSFVHVEDLLKRLQVLKLPFMVLACKSDLERVVDPKLALDLLKRYDSGLVEATKESDAGKDRMRRSFEWLIKAILRDRSRSDTNPDYRNPASPDALASLPPWENPPKARTSTDSSAVATPTASSSMTSMRTVAESQAQGGSSRLQQMPTMPTISSPRSPSVPTSPTRARSMSDLLSEHEKLKNQGDRIQNVRNNMMTLSITGSVSSDQLHTTVPTSSEKLSGGEEVVDPKEAEQKPSRPTQWATLDELLDKLIFLAVSGDDPTFITHFLLTYRRFASPRSVLLAMQKRMRQLDNPSGDPMFACYAQMRICHLLEVWIRDYPYDFAVRGTAGALNALVKAVVAKTYLLHYGCEFLPFTELVIKHEDLDEAWALPVEDLADESDESYSLYDEEEEETPDESDSATADSVDHLMVNHRPPSIVVSSRENKSILPLSYVIPGSLDMTLYTPSFHPDDPDFKKLLKDLARNSLEIAAIDPALIAEEITRIEANYFLDIQPRHWLHYTLASGKKDPEVDTIAKFNAYSNNLADWVVSLILCHDRPKHRARQIEKFIDIAQRLRGLNNYSALRAFVAGINNSTFPSDVTMELFKTKVPDMYKTFQSWDILFQAARSHRAYRMALKSSKGACIPALEVHMSDLIRAHEGNAETNADYPNKIHWGKFNMIGKFVHSTTLCQVQCRSTQDYNFKENVHVQKLMQQSVMSVEMQRSRIAPPPEEPFDEPSRPVIPRTFSRDATGSNQSKDVTNPFRKLFAW